MTEFNRALSDAIDELAAARIDYSTTPPSRWRLFSEHAAARRLRRAEEIVDIMLDREISARISERVMAQFSGEKR